MALYTETVMDHFRNPRNVGELPDANGVGEVGNAKCGDIMKMYLKIKDDRHRRTSSSRRSAAAAAIASSSIATEMIKGKTVEEALALTNKEVVDALGGLPAAQAALLRAGRRGRQIRRAGLLRAQQYPLRQVEVPEAGGLRVLPHGLTSKNLRTVRFAGF